MGFCYKKLWKLLIDKGLNKSELCQKACISRSTLNKLKNGDNVNTEILERICDVLNCDISDIVEVNQHD